MYVYVPHLYLMPAEARRQHQILPENGGTDSCDLPYECWERNSGPSAASVLNSWVISPALHISTFIGTSFSNTWSRLQD